ncbi:MAG: ATP-binding protein [Pirellulaceae bacterium]|nr:ATP-binding protein [Pirellulaceae bacterium]
MTAAKFNFSPDEIAKRWPRMTNAATTPDQEAAADRDEKDRIGRAEEARRRADAERFLVVRGGRYRNCRLSNFEAELRGQADAVARLRDYLEHLPEHVERGHNIVLFGPSGTGKDHLATAMAYAAIRRGGYSVAYTAGLDLYARLRATIDGRADEADVITPLVKADILLLSDPIPPIGELTRYQTEVLYRIIDARYSHPRPTWVTLNVASGAEASDRLSPPVYDRLRHGATAVYCDWPSYRQPQERDER